MLRDGGIDAVAALNESLREAIAELPEDMRAETRLAIGQAMAAVLAATMEPMVRAFPELEPGEAEQRDERTAERRLAQPSTVLDRVRDPERGKHGGERRAPAVGRLADDADPLGRRPVLQRAEKLGSDQLEGASRAGALEEREGALEGRPGMGRVDEERTLDVLERRGERADDPTR